jgi:hypothetical protein
MLRLYHVSRTEEKGAGARSPTTDESAEGVSLGAAGSVDRLDVVAEQPEPDAAALRAGGCRVPDESERTRLITDICRVIQESTVPEGARAAGLTLIGWLARRRSDEVPHAIGVEEARESERRIRAARLKMR